MANLGILELEPSIRNHWMSMISTRAIGLLGRLTDQRSEPNLSCDLGIYRA